MKALLNPAMIAVYVGIVIFVFRNPRSVGD